jgi:hypothetical protein
MIRADYAHFTPITEASLDRGHLRAFARLLSAEVDGLRVGAGERDRTADLPFTRRPLCQLSYTGGGLAAW